MRPIRPTPLASATSTPPLPVNWRANPTDIGLSAIVSASGSMTWKVQFTTDDIQAAGYSPATGNWFDTGITAKTASDHGTLAEPATAVRFTITTYGSGTLTPIVIQAGGQD